MCVAEFAWQRANEIAGRGITLRRLPNPRLGEGRGVERFCRHLRLYVFPMDSPCSERDRLLNEYRDAVSAFGEVANRTDPDSRALRQLTQWTSEAWQNARNAILEHERKHGCGNGGLGSMLC